MRLIRFRQLQEICKYKDDGIGDSPDYFTTCGNSEERFRKSNLPFAIVPRNCCLKNCPEYELLKKVKDDRC